MTKYISLLNDTTFKYLWKEEKSRKWLNKLIYYITNIDISEYELIDNELNSGDTLKDYRLDIVLRKKENTLNVEMNSIAEEYVLLKNHSYLYRLAGNEFNKGDKYTKYKVIQVNFNNSLCKINKNIGIAIFEFQDKENNMKIEEIKDYEVYLPKYKNICYNNNNEKELMLALFTATSYKEMRRLANGNKEALNIVEELEKLSEDKYFGALYDNRIVQKKLENSAFDLGEQKGYKKRTHEIFMSLKEKRLAKEEIMSILNIDEDKYLLLMAESNLIEE